LQDREHAVHPRVGLWVAQRTWPAVPGVEGRRFLEDEKTQEWSFHLWQAACGAATALTLALLALPGLVCRRASGRGRRTRRQETRTLVVRQASRGEECSRSVV
jgi:hypothetical protein